MSHTEIIARMFEIYGLRGRGLLQQHSMTEVLILWEIHDTNAREAGGRSTQVQGPVSFQVHDAIIHIAQDNPP